MIENKDYVTFDVAKLLKEKGYDKPSKYYYRKDDGNFMEAFSLLYNDMGFDTVECIAPTLVEAAKWLREKGVYLYPVPELDKRTGNVWYKIKIITHSDLVWGRKGKIIPICSESYEEALDAGIEYALKHVNKPLEYV